MATVLHEKPRSYNVSNPEPCHGRGGAFGPDIFTQEWYGQSNRWKFDAPPIVARLPSPPVNRVVLAQPKLQHRAIQRLVNRLRPAPSRHAADHTRAFHTINSSRGLFSSRILYPLLPRRVFWLRTFLLLFSVLYGQRASGNPLSALPPSPCCPRAPHSWSSRLSPCPFRFSSPASRISFPAGSFLRFFCPRVLSAVAPYIVPRCCLHTATPLAVRAAVLSLLPAATTAAIAVCLFSPHCSQPCPREVQFTTARVASSPFPSLTLQYFHRTTSTRDGQHKQLNFQPLACCS